MPTIRVHHVDAFTERVFAGNPAAVCPLDTWLPDSVMQAIAAENNLPATAFFVLEDDHYRLRWFSPVAELELCGHATLASADVLFRMVGHPGLLVRFETRSGTLTVTHQNGVYALDLPAVTPEPCAVSSILAGALAVTPVETLRALDHIVVLASETQVRALRPDLAALAGLDLRGVCVTAPGDHVDFVSRFFAPKVGIPEDSVTGSAHCALAPYWAQRLGKVSLTATQVSPRGGSLVCEAQGDRVTLRGRAAHYMSGEIAVP